MKTPVSSPAVSLVIRRSIMAVVFLGATSACRSKPTSGRTPTVNTATADRRTASMPGVGMGQSPPAEEVRGSGGVGGAVGLAVLGPTLPPSAAADGTGSHSQPTTVTVTVLTEPALKASVHWGAKALGVTPLEVKRPRASGPLDLVIRAPGYLTVHTRAFTDRNDKVVIRLVPETEAPHVLGYRPIQPANRGQSAPTRVAE